jgi:hypothetical protein
MAAEIVGMGLANGSAGEKVCTGAVRVDEGSSQLKLKTTDTRR